MTKYAMKSALLSLAMIGTALPAASAMAADVTPPATSQYIVKSASDGLIRAGAKAFKRGQLERSVKYSRAALKTNLSAKRAAIAQSNLCAAYASLGNMSQAQAACTSAIELRPDYGPAQNNKAALTYQLAQK